MGCRVRHLLAAVVAELRATTAAGHLRATFYSLNVGLDRTSKSESTVMMSMTTDHCFTLCVPRSGELRTQKLKSHLVRTQSLNVLPLKPGVGLYIAIHATLTARDFFLACLFLHFRSIHLHFFQNLSRFVPVLAVANTWFLCRPAE